MIKEFQINFLSETIFNQEIELFLKQESEDEFTVAAIRKSDKKNIFTVKLIFE